VIDGLTFKGFTDMALIRASANHIEVKNCTFQDGGGFFMVEDCGGGWSYHCPVSHIWVHGNQFLRNVPGGTPCLEGGDSIRIGYPPFTIGNQLGTSTTSNTIGVGSKTFTSQAGMSLVVGNWVRLQYDGSNRMYGAVTDYTGTSLTVLITEGNYFGSGTYTSWTISTCTGGKTNHITVENNVVAGAGHTGLDSYGEYNVIKDNYFQNEPWYTASDSGCNYPNTNYTNPAYNGKYGHRAFHMDDSFNRDSTNNLVEGNRFGYGSPNPNNDGANSIDIGAPKNIIRYNYIFGAMNNGFMFKWGGIGVSGRGGCDNAMYNNTVYHNGYGYPTSETSNWFMEGIHFYYGDRTTGNKIKNNIVYDNRRYYKSGYDIPPNSLNTIVNNWTTAEGDPKFVNPDLTTPTNRTLPNLALQSSSPAIDGGTYLTQANGAGSNSTTLIVDDALYFQDGTWGSSLAGHLADWIAIGTVTNVVQISSINYTTNTISLKSPMTWSDNANIWLYKKSDGTPVLHGSAPDFGAHESSNPAPPANLRVLQ
jgi:hypothetical protein